MTAYTWFSS